MAAKRQRVRAEELATSPVKIVATLGPATESADMIEALARAGVNVFRINLSHATPDEAALRLRRIRATEQLLGRSLVAMGDLAGPKIRIGEVAPDTVVEMGDVIDVVASLGAAGTVGTRKRISVNRPEILSALSVGGRIYLGDGALELEVVRRIPQGVRAVVRVGGPLLSRKGFVAHGMPVLDFALTVRDRAHITALTKQGIDAFAVSFVQTARDIQKVAALLPKRNRPLLVAKIETASGVANADAIIAAADALMVARGDLGFAMPLEQLPHAQKQLIATALVHAKPVITATQMLESMMINPVPTRAEVTDIANALLDGTDAVMLSGETASGRFPIEAVETLRRVATEATRYVGRRFFADDNETPGAVSAATVRIADQIGARAIIVFTESGATARRIARHRPAQRVIALSPHLRTVRSLQFTWGVHAMQMPNLTTIEEGIAFARTLAHTHPLLRLVKGEQLVISAGLPFGTPGSTNVALVQRV